MMWPSPCTKIPCAVFGADVFYDVALGTVIVQIDPPKKAADRPVLDRDVLAVVCSDAVGVRSGTGSEPTEFKAVEIEHDVVRDDGDGVARRHGSVQVAGEAIDALDGDDGGERGDRRAVNGLGPDRDGAQGDSEHDEQRGGELDGGHWTLPSVEGWQQVAGSLAADAHFHHRVQSGRRPEARQSTLGRFHRCAPTRRSANQLLFPMSVPPV